MGRKATKVLAISAIPVGEIACLFAPVHNVCFQIKRPYFHVKPLERCQLKNWKSYLEWEKQHGSLKRALVLHERCLIACALYEEFWMRVCN